MWLRADLDVLVQRVSRRADRPLLKAGDPRGILAELIERRYPIYAEAEVTIDSGDGSPEATVSRVDRGARRLPVCDDAARCRRAKDDDDASQTASERLRVALGRARL